MLRRLPHALPVGAAFFLSGAAALAYQVAWQRILALQTGVGLYSIAVIVAGFMVGLGVGSHLGAVASTRVTPRRALLLFAACELGVAAFGAMSVHFYYGWLYVRWGWLFGDPVRGALVQLASLLFPTVLMGMSLPFLTRAMVRDAGSAGGTIGLLYGVNVLGAAAGALATPWVFIRHHGIPAAITAAAVANLVAGLAALLIARWLPDAPEDSPPLVATVPAAPPAEAPRAFRTWLVLYALSGFAALALEILWFRIMDVAVKSTAYTFGTVLALYLLGSATGAFLGTAYVRRVTRPLRTFLLLQCVLLGYAGAVLAVLPHVPPTLPGFQWYYEVWGGTRSFNLGGAMYWDSLLKLYVILPFVLFGPPTVLMGLSFPILQRAVQDDAATSGWKVGVLQAANIGGCVAGSLVVGLLTLTFLGTPGTMRLLLGVGVVFAMVGLRVQGGRNVFAPLAVVLLLLAVALPGQREFWMRLHGTSRSGTLLAEDATGVSALIPSANERLWRVWSGGRSHSWLPFGGIHTTLGAAPALIHPSPRRVAIIGLGSGDTAASAGCRRDVDQRLTVFEIHRPQRSLLASLLAAPDPPGRLARFLNDPRYTFRVADGRNALLRDGETYDLIEADALWPTSPYAGNLYSLEFFRLCAGRLSPGGMVTTWAPTDRVRATFYAAFPHVLELGKGEVLIGSATAVPIDPEEWRRRLDAAPVVAYLGPPRVAGVWADLSTARAVASPGGAGINHDLFPRDEFHSPD